MSIGPQSSMEVCDRFLGEVDSDYYGIGGYGREDFLIFPDNHPSTWIIAFKAKDRFVVIAFYPHEANNHEFNDWEEFEMSPQHFVEHFGIDGGIEEFFAKKKIEWEAWL